MTTKYNDHQHFWLYGSYTPMVPYDYNYLNFIQWPVCCGQDVGGKNLLVKIKTTVIHI